jgi:unsaturated rhamnogalacturonyl hydrolase
MRHPTRREILQWCASLPFLKTASALGLFNNDNPRSIDWSAGVVENAMHLWVEPAAAGRWGYQAALYMYGQYLVYLRNRDPRYLNYVQRWVDGNLNEDGTIKSSLDALDYMLGGIVLLALFRETNQPKYKTAAQTIRKRFDTYPRTQDGGFWHATSRQHQLWLDGMYMSMPFLIRYGAMFDDQQYACDEATRQLLIYAKHLNDPTTGLLFHAYDESGKQSWADPVTHHSSVFWCRSIGWYGMALIEVLEILPRDHPQRANLIALVHQLAKAYERYQDPKTGLWYEVVDKGSLPANWHETSSSCMYTYTLSKAIERHYIGRHYRHVMRKGYAGVLSQLSRDNNGLVHIENICEGTNVSDLNYYLSRPRKTDDLHGIGAFLIMNEQMRIAGV